MKTALTVAGSDPTGGAGLQADLKVFKSLGIHGLSVVSSITAQNSEGVDFVLPVDDNTLEKQLHVLLSDIRPHAAKTGMLYKKETVYIIENALKKYSLNNMVVDPVAVSSSGVRLVENGTLDLLRDILFPFSRVITPNIYEAFLLTGITIKNRCDMENAAKKLKDTGTEAVVITGGHFKEKALDLYYDGEVHILEGEKMKGEYHGTGCVFSAVITALLALDNSPLEAVRRAKEFVKKAIENAYNPGRGMSFISL